MNITAPIKLCVFIVSLLYLSGCQLANSLSFFLKQQQANVKWTTPDKTTSVPFTTYNHHIIVPVSINGGEPLRFVLDTGAAATVITQSPRTKHLSFKKDSPIAISGSGNDGDPTAYVLDNITLSTGDFSIANLSVIYATTDALPFDSQDETYFDGVIGADFFNRTTIEIDYGNMQVTFAEPPESHEHFHDQRLAQGWQFHAMPVHSDTPFIDTHVTINDKKHTVKVMIDTGSTGYLSLFMGVLPEGVTVPAKHYEARSRGISGYSRNKVGLVDNMTLAGFNVNHFPAYFRSEGENPQSGSHGVLGNQILRQFNAIVDFEHEALYLKPIRDGVSSQTLPHLGLRILPHENGGIIKAIYEFSALPQNTFNVGDIITSINQTPVNSTSFDHIMQTISKNSSNHSHIEVCIAGHQDCYDIPISPMPWENTVGK
ncbi:aspartyl protease family protein [Aestuariibacter sp. AA17]|uniref:Aspartyl protease family protein n=1 Tax=Fluctibacter corallii TaxID=2984329 RepID=A0ABT3ABS3_9ALTE|nr:aspartyl protease family protein [Aestuariibacter sp. AA17]MCV2885712.1 aspartyl protease family protein [Aestuariibacter sp. AA17]